MSFHNDPKYQIPALIESLKAHRLAHDKPDQLSDAFRIGWLAAIAQPAPPVEPVDVQMTCGAKGDWRRVDGGVERAEYLMRTYPGKYQMRKLYAAPQPVQPAAAWHPTEAAIAALKRFEETCSDGEGYDVPKDTMRILAAIGLIYKTHGATYRITDFGRHILEALIVQPVPTAAPVAWQSAVKGDVSAARLYFDKDEPLIPLYPHPSVAQAIAQPVPIAAVGTVELTDDDIKQVWLQVGSLSEWPEIGSTVRFVVRKCIAAIASKEVKL